MLKPEERRHTSDLDAKFTLEDVEKLFGGVDGVFCVFQMTHAHIQPMLTEATKKSGVKRFVYCDWSTALCEGSYGDV